MPAFKTETMNGWSKPFRILIQREAGRKWAVLYSSGDRGAAQFAWETLHAKGRLPTASEAMHASRTRNPRTPQAKDDSGKFTNEPNPFIAILAQSNHDDR